MTEQPTYPVYEKNGMTQIAASPAREIELRYAGWRKREDPKEPAPADSGTPGEQGAEAAPPAQPKPKPRNKPADQ